MIDPNKSFIQVIQSIGRGLRKAEDKDSVCVWDVSTDLKYGKKHASQRRTYYKEQKYSFFKYNIDYRLPESELIDKIHNIVELGLIPTVGTTNPLDSNDDIVVY